MPLLCGTLSGKQAPPRQGLLRLSGLSWLYPRYTVTDVDLLMVDVDDPYVEERVIAAAFGAITAHQMPDPGGAFERALSEWLEELKRWYLVGGDRPTSHELIRTYVRASFEFAAELHPSALPDGIDGNAMVFATPPAPAPIHEADEHADE